MPASDLTNEQTMAPARQLPPDLRRELAVRGIVAGRKETLQEILRAS